MLPFEGCCLVGCRLDLYLLDLAGSSSPHPRTYRSYEPPPLASLLQLQMAGLPHCHPSIPLLRGFACKDQSNLKTFLSASPYDLDIKSPPRTHGLEQLTLRWWHCPGKRLWNLWEMESSWGTWGPCLIPAPPLCFPTEDII